MLLWHELGDVRHRKAQRRSLPMAGKQRASSMTPTATVKRHALVDGDVMDLPRAQRRRSRWECAAIVAIYTAQIG